MGILKREKHTAGNSGHLNPDNRKLSETQRERYSDSQNTVVPWYFCLRWLISEDKSENITARVLLWTSTEMASNILPTPTDYKWGPGAFVLPARARRPPITLRKMSIWGPHRAKKERMKQMTRMMKPQKSVAAAARPHAARQSHRHLLDRHANSQTANQIIWPPAPG